MKTEAMGKSMPDACQADLICVHALVSDGVFTPEGEFLPLPRLDTTVVLEVFRRLWLRRLHQAERLSEAFMNNLLSWVHPGFTVFAGPPVAAGNLESLESQARYIARPAMAMDALEQRGDGTFAMETPRDPRSGATLVVLDALEWIHRITAHIPDPGQHTRRSYGAYSNRARVTAAAAQDESWLAAHARSGGGDADFARETRRSWARLLRKIFEVDVVHVRGRDEDRFHHYATAHRGPHPAPSPQQSLPGAGSL